MWSECKLLSDKTKSNEKMSSKPMRLWKKRLLFVFFCMLQKQCGQVTGDKQVLWLLSSHLALLHSTNYDSLAGAVAYMGLTCGNSGFNSLHPVPSGDTSYFWFSKNAFFQTFHHKEHRAGYAWQQRLKSEQEVSEQRTTRRSVSYPVHSKVVGSPGAETKCQCKFSNDEII